jgi:hypothetical protein
VRRGIVHKVEDLANLPIGGVHEAHGLHPRPGAEA